MPSRPLTKSEKTKLFLFLGLLFLLGNLFGWQFLFRQAQTLSADLQKLRADRTYAEAWMAEKDFWSQRRQWLADHQPKLSDPAQGNVLLLESLQKLATTHKLTIMEQTLLDPRRDRFYQEVSVQLRLNGSLESICRWLVAVQQPEEFQAISNFSIKSDSDANKVRCDLRVAKWYQ